MAANEGIHDVADSEMSEKWDEQRWSQLVHKWQIISSVSVSVGQAVASTWLQLASASILLNSKEIGMNATKRDSARRSLGEKFFASENDCHFLLRMSLVCSKYYVIRLRVHDIWRSIIVQPLKSKLLHFSLSRDKILRIALFDSSYVALKKNNQSILS